jgi:hypothetical protein
MDRCHFLLASLAGVLGAAPAADAQQHAFFWRKRARLVALAARHRLPAMYPEVEFVEAGGAPSTSPSGPRFYSERIR